LEWGSQVKSLKAFEASTGKKSDRLASRPTLRPDCLKYMRAFSSLSNARQHSQIGGAQPISLTEIKAYIDLHGIQYGEVSSRYVRMIQKMDYLYLDKVQERLAQQGNNKKQHFGGKNR